MITNIQVAATLKGAFFYLRVRYQQENCRIYYWQATGIRADQPRYLVEQARRRVLAALYEEARCEAQCAAWGVDYALRQQPPSAWLAHWLEGRRESVCEHSFRQYAVIVRRAGAFLDGQADTLAHLTPYGLECYLDSLRENGMAETTIGLHLRVLHMALQAARDCGLIRFNPASGIAMPRAERDIPAPYTPAELQQLLTVCLGTDLYLPVLLAAIYGLRCGEVCGLCWDDVDFDTGKLHVRRNAVMTHDESGRCRMVCSEAMKTRASRRSFPLTPRLQALLRRHQSQTGHRTGPVFKCRHGGPMRPDTLTRQFNRLLAQHGLRPIRFHDLRHSCATELARRGCEVPEIQAFLGHSNTATTLQYIHPDADSNRRSLLCLERALHSAI